MTTRRPSPTARERALRLVRKARALESSPNANEAARAAEKVRDLVARYGLTEEELADAGEGVVRVGGPASRRDNWKEVVAFGVGKRWSCRPLRGHGHIAFEGVRATSAASEYRHLVQAIEEAQDRRWRAYDHKYRLIMQEEHRRNFLRAAAEATLETALGEASHSLQVSFADEGWKEGRAIVRALRLGEVYSSRG